MKKQINKIAIVRLSALGDIVNTAVVLQFIHQKYPDAKVEWITEEVFAPLLQNHPLLHAVHSINLKKLKKEKSFTLLKELISHLRSLGTFDIIIDVQGLLKSAIVARLIGKNTHGYDKTSAREGVASMLYKTTSHIAYDENIIKRNTFVVADGLGFEVSDQMILEKKPIFPKGEKDPILSKTQKNIALVIGASWESKKYPKEKVLQLCDALQENCIILWGGEDEKKDAEWICKNSHYTTMAPKLSLEKLMHLISHVDLLIGNDTGPTHMAWAQNIASITLFGPTTSRMIYETPQNIGIKSPSDVDIFKIDKSDFSIKEIDPNIITQKAKELLDGI